MVNNSHSLWISTQPTSISNDRLIPPLPNTYVYLGGNSEITYDNQYNAGVVGVYKQPSSEAYFVDSTGGSVSQISISCTRVQPINYDDSSTDLANISNGKFIMLLEEMKQKTQLLQGAYILRMYNTTQNAKTSGIPYDIPVYIVNFTYKYNLEQPNVINITLKLIKRNYTEGFSLGTTKY